MRPDPLLLAGAKSKGKRPQFLENRDTERLMNIVMTLAQEVAVMRERIDTIERLLEKKKTISRADIEKFAPTKAQANERGAWTQEFLARILRVVQQEQEALTAKDMTNEDFADELARN
jgi:hypothetical protein